MLARIDQLPSGHFKQFFQRLKRVWADMGWIAPEITGGFAQIGDIRGDNNKRGTIAHRAMQQSQ